MSKEKLFEYLVQYGGEIVSSNDLNVENINQARASDRMWVDENSYGFVWLPPAKFPQTEEEVILFDKWFPLPAKIPEDLTYENLLRRIEERKQRKNN